MIQFRPATDRGHTHIGWLNSHHTFSFGEYRDPQQMGYRSLRVINDDRVVAGAGVAGVVTRLNSRTRDSI